MQKSASTNCFLRPESAFLSALGRSLLSFRLITFYCKFKNKTKFILVNADPLAFIIGAAFGSFKMCLFSDSQIFCFLMVCSIRLYTHSP